MIKPLIVVRELEELAEHHQTLTNIHSYIDELEGNQVQRAFFIIRKRNGQEVFFSKKESAELFLSNHESKSEMRLVCTSFCDID